MDIGNALTFITDDPRWKEKLGIGVALILISFVLSFVLVGILGFLIVTGYYVRLLQNVRDRVTYPLPEWDQWGDDMVRGLKLSLAILIWSLPIILLNIPITIGGALTENGEASSAIGGLILLCGLCLVFAYSVVLALLQPGITVMYATNERFGDALQVQEIWEWTRSRIGQVVIVVLVSVAAGLAFSLIGLTAGVLLCGVGLIVTLPLTGLVTSLFQHHLYGQLTWEGGTAAVVAAPPMPPVPPVPPMPVDLGTADTMAEAEGTVVDLAGEDEAPDGDGAESDGDRATL